VPGTGFDIRSLVEFRPPTYRCERCLGILTGSGYFALGGSSVDDERCPVCGVQYQPVDSEYGGHSRAYKYLEEVGLQVPAKDMTAHATALARIAVELGRSPYIPPVAVLNKALARARAFVHVISWGIDYQMMGALKLAAQWVPVAAVISNVGANLRTELMEYPREAPKLSVRTVPSNAGWGDPHQKLVVIDGLLAFTGSANFTVNSWRKSADGHDLLETVTDVTRVRELNNRFFSPVWAELGDVAGPISMMSEPF